MAKFGGLPVGLKDSDPVKIEKWFNEKFKKKFPELDFKEEFKKIGGKIPPKK